MAKHLKLYPSLTQKIVDSLYCSSCNRKLRDKEKIEQFTSTGYKDLRYGEGKIYTKRTDHPDIKRELYIFFCEDCLNKWLVLSSALKE